MTTEQVWAVEAREEWEQSYCNVRADGKLNTREKEWGLQVWKMYACMQFYGLEHAVCVDGGCRFTGAGLSMSEECAHVK